MKLWHSKNSIITVFLEALAKRMPSIAHRKRDSEIVDIELAAILVGDTLVIHPHEICPADGLIIEGHGTMDESYRVLKKCKLLTTIERGVAYETTNDENENKKANSSG